MSYFNEVAEYQSYSHGEADFHFIYNSNSGGGQSFLGGQFLNEIGKLSSPTILDGHIGVFCITTGEVHNQKRRILLNDAKGRYEIKPRGEGSTSMKLGVGTTMVSPNKLISSFFMLPPTCTIKTPKNLDISILTSNNYWLQSMWLECGQKSEISKEVYLMPIDFVFCGGNSKESSGIGRYFKLDAERRIADIISLSENTDRIPEAIRQYVKLFAEIYTENAPFEYNRCCEAISRIMVSLSKDYPDKYTGIEDPLPFLMHMAFPDATEYIQKPASNNKSSLQVIYYGAPGTGKSHTIQKVTAEAEQKGNLFRTTFHPDSDYATFVGCYKPSMESKERRYDKDELISKLAIIKNTGVTYPCHKFAAKYWESLKGMTRDEKKSIITACEFPETMVVEIDKGIVIGEELSHGTNQKQIVYRFVAQAFANAYVRAWQKNQEDEKVFLVIEEINRGNCAQIFGDLFQLLDRDDEGYSKYPIIPDADLADFICEHLQTYENIPEAIREGLEMKLPSNFYIWASMNTSDQSLFPIDSAFKRRWDWEYIPIENHPDEDYKIHINGSVYGWWDFIQAINKEVFELTHSEDKQLGYFFVRPQNGIIDVNMLVNKVYFYLWNDVFKDYDIESQKAFKKPDSNEAIAFKDFFEGGLNEKLAEQILINLELGEEIQMNE